jgi:integrase
VARGLCSVASDLHGDTLRIQRSLLRLGKPTRGWSLAPTKTGRNRLVPLPAFAVEVLREHRRAQAVEILAAGEGYTRQEFMFASKIGTPLDLSTLTAEHFRPILKRAKLPRVRLYDLRHSCATLLFAQGVPAKIVQERLGHSTIALTLDTYTHVLPGMQASAAATLDAVLGTRRSG